MSIDKIPKSFELCGQKIDVVIDPGLAVREGYLGLSDYTANKIYLQSHENNDAIPYDKIVQIFFHELVHFILYYAEEDSFDPELYKREKLVSRVGSLLHQAVKTMKF